MLNPEIPETDMFPHSKMKLVEPLCKLFKDEVMEVGIKLGLLDEIVMRQPFPGPRLAVCILGPITKSGLDTLR
jgi:GMP synthase (glutamine-hydrolysing)